MLLRKATLRDTLPSKGSVVMVDEAHERNLNSDAILGLIKKIQRKRKDLRIIVCSATIDEQDFRNVFFKMSTTGAQAGKKSVDGDLLRVRPRRRKSC
jgi:ATP-dependent RNA helicase DDX35